MQGESTQKGIPTRLFGGLKDKVELALWKNHRGLGDYLGMVGNIILGSRTGIGKHEVGGFAHRLVVPGAMITKLCGI